MTPGTRLRHVEARVYRQPIAQPVVTSFGTMRDRPAVLVRVEDEDGVIGYGEIWCNFPSVGPEHRARLVNALLGPMLLAQDVTDPASPWALLTQRTAVLALQCAEPGPFAQCIAGIDIALWDLAARRAGQPLWRLLGGGSPNVPVYASGINPERPEAMVEVKLAEGHCRFKLKVGFGIERDVRNLQTLRKQLGSDAVLCVDANQAWSLDEAAGILPQLEPFGLAWLEEPLRADRPWSEWRQLAARTAIPLAGGENISGRAAFEEALAEDALAIVQPDVAKWGGLSGCLPVARAALAAGRRYCPHYLGAGIGLLASAHLLAAAGGDGWLEIDSNENPLRDLLCGPISQVLDGQVTLTEAPGLGIAPDLVALEAIRCAV
ncbi:mandelate racemase/muconate lactonizing enzyme family protein [Variovorax humicola]|uniref:Mandelate racemase/muconate lactonizing enzyme family protein n=1 Tax=Variovorax humicola TaxID=1769758 RepID=A0ABU8W3I0_9BURK